MEFTAYQFYEVPGYDIEPAPLKRDWMDATDGFAYRCLPLSMANQAGWIVRCPVTFTAKWSGEDRHGSLRFRIFSNNRAWQEFILDNFGFGIITFSLPYLLRTPPGYGLLVRGAPNFWVANAHPLEGLVETDWPESTFTMNWKIVDAAREVTFRAGDPICFLQPYPLDLLESLEPSVVPLASDEELSERYAAWSASRRSFLERTDRKASEWQKDYFLGKTTDGGKVDRHRTRFHLKAFRKAAAEPEPVSEL